MSTIKSSSANLTLNADGSNNDIIFQSNASNVATLDQAGLLTATTFAGSGASLTGLTSSQMPAGSVIQVVYVQDLTVKTTTTTIPHDDSRPLISEGVEVLSLAITPTSSSSKLFFTTTAPTDGFFPVEPIFISA